MRKDVNVVVVRAVWPDDFIIFNIWLFTTMKICPLALQICQNKLKILPNTKWTLSKWPKCFNILPKWWNFAKSGHTLWGWKKERKKGGAKTSCFQNFQSRISCIRWSSFLIINFSKDILILPILKSQRHDQFIWIIVYFANWWVCIITSWFRLWFYKCHSHPSGCYGVTNTYGQSNVRLC